MTLSTATLGQLQRVEDPHGLLVLLTLSSPVWAQPARLVNDTRDWTIDGTTWVGLPFRCTLPDEAAGQAPRAQLEIDNVGSTLGKALDQVTPNVAVTATITLVSRARPSVQDLSFEMPLSNVTMTVRSVTATIGDDDVLRAPAVMARYDMQLTPGLFEG